MKLYIFNPDTDLALANNRENYMPPARVRQMTQELEMLPLWYSEAGSCIFAPSGRENSEFLAEAKNLFGVEAECIKDITQLPCNENIEITPWGWNLALRRQLLGRGIDESLLPTPQELALYRELSGRDKDTEILRSMHPSAGFTAKVIDNIEECREYAAKHPRCIFKAPWSGSGKGLLWCWGKYDDKSDGWCRRIIAEQGFVVATPIYEKVQDFAIEYYCDGEGNLSFVGYSLFSTNTKGAYQGNILQSEAMHRETLSQFITLHELDTTDTLLREKLATIYGRKYKGYIGVDMIICRTSDDTNALHPCVEVNMRMNMGVLSTILTKRFLAEGSRAIFSIDYYPAAEELQSFLARMEKDNPRETVNGKLVAGFVPLVPIGKSNNYIAYIKAERGG